MGWMLFCPSCLVSGVGESSLSFCDCHWSNQVVACSIGCYLDTGIRSSGQFRLREIRDTVASVASRFFQHLAFP